MGALLAIAAGGFIITTFNERVEESGKWGQVVQQGIIQREPAPKSTSDDTLLSDQSQSVPQTLLKAPNPPLKLPLPEQMVKSPDRLTRAYEEELPTNLYRTEPAKTDITGRPGPNYSTGSASALPVERPMWQRNAVAINKLAKTVPIVSIVIDDAGVDRIRTARAVALPGPLTISYLTYASGLARQTAIAREAGHELLVHVAMEPTNQSVDPGPRVLRTNFDAQELLLRLRWGLSQFTGYVGINNHMGSRFTSDTKGMRIVLSELKSRGLLFLDSRTSKQTVGGQIAHELDVPFVERNVFLDHDPNIEVVNRQLQLVEREARRHGYAVAIGHPRDATLDALDDWLPTISERGIRLVPISAIVARRRGIELAAR